MSEHDWLNAVMLYRHFIIQLLIWRLREMCEAVIANLGENFCIYFLVLINHFKMYVANFLKYSRGILLVLTNIAICAH